MKASLEGGDPIDLCSGCGGVGTWSPAGASAQFEWTHRSDTLLETVELVPLDLLGRYPAPGLAGAHA